MRKDKNTLLERLRFKMYVKGTVRETISSTSPKKALMDNLETIKKLISSSKRKST